MCRRDSRPRPIAITTPNEKNIETETENAALLANIADRYDFVVCGSGWSGSVVAARAAENPDVTVLLVEAGGADDAPEVVKPGLWPDNLGSERDWAFAAEPSAHINGRSLELNMGKVLGGGSSISPKGIARMGADPCRIQGGHVTFLTCVIQTDCDATG